MKNRDIPNTKKPTSPLQSDFEPPLAHLSGQEADRTSNFEASHLWIFVQKK